MSFGPLGWRSSSSHNPRLAGLSKPSTSSNRLSLASSSPISRSLTSLGGSLGGSAVDQYIASAASSNYTSSPSHRRSPHVRRPSQPPTNRLRASSQTNLSSLPNSYFPSQTFAVICLQIATLDNFLLPNFTPSLLKGAFNKPDHFLILSESRYSDSVASFIMSPSVKCLFYNIPNFCT